MRKGMQGLMIRNLKEIVMKITLRIEIHNLKSNLKTKGREVEKIMETEIKIGTEIMTGAGMEDLAGRLKEE